MQRLIDTAWDCIDLNSSVLASMPVYLLGNGQVMPPIPWMTNPDPMIYTSWQEFAKQFFWDFHLGEVFVLPMAKTSDGLPMQFRVVPPWLINVEMKGGGRQYTLGFEDVTADILHVRYQSTTTDAHGHGPLEVAGARMVTAGLIQRYARKLVETGGTPHYWIGIDTALTKAQADDMLEQWVESRISHPADPAFISRGGKLNQTQAMSAKDMALLELEQFSESRIAVALGVPPFLAGLPAGGDSLTYSNVSQLFDFHDRSSLRPKADAGMSALSGWALPPGLCCELNRDEYSRPGFLERVQGYQLLFNMIDENGQRGITVQEIRQMERLHGESSAVSLTGGYDT